MDQTLRGRFFKPATVSNCRLLYSCSYINCYFSEWMQLYIFTGFNFSFHTPLGGNVISFALPHSFKHSKHKGMCVCFSVCVCVCALLETPVSSQVLARVSDSNTPLWPR